MKNQYPQVEELKTYAVRYTDFITAYEDSITYGIYSKFDKKHSWSTKQNPILLNHEQIHFDIFEVYSRQFRYDLSNYVETNVSTTNTFIQNLANKYDSLTYSVNISYDIETKHGTDVKAQKRWDAKVDSMLAGLEAYSSPLVVFKVGKEQGMYSIS